MGCKRNGEFSLWLMGIFVFASAILGDTVRSAPGFNNARSMGMGGGYTALARGVEAPNWNPANLGLDLFENHWSLTLFDLGLQVFNNSYTKSQYDQYNGNDISEARQKILDTIHGQELNLCANGEFGIIGLAYKSFAFNVQALVFTKVELSKSLLELMLFGNSQKASYNFSPISGNGIALWKISYSGAKPLSINGFQEAALGASVNIYSGKSVFEIVHAQAQTQTTQSYISADGEISLRHSMGGRGLGMNIGISGLTRSNWYLSVAILNLFTYLSWQREAKFSKYYFTLTEANMERLSEIEQIDELYHTSNVTVPLSSFSTQLPEMARFGLARNWNRFTISMDYKQGLRNLAGTSLTPEFAFGFEYKNTKNKAFRTGMALGGNIGYACAIGAGLRFGIFYWDIGCNWVRAFWPGHARGLAFAMSTRLKF